ncbi:unnamed protein product [Kluyveromyces dobzhanskii CBS 2104]|uniref:WGS project CCBQ000000000 data, contig MAT n=1 Tax=Kluyveromyces dobzhanskii CBS 2104 TaxID=1427455 RepID=A0A0A8L1V9_9SACH|nr:unnamed protein product [Kluyveromyces dobzhanskii CBS 2104]
MEDRSRVLEPLDTNSLSFSGIHSIETDTMLSNKKQGSPFDFCADKEWMKAEGNLDNTPLKWRSQRDEFIFNSNSTPSRPGIHDNAQLPVRDIGRKRNTGQRRRLVLSGAGPQVSKSHSSLQAQTSKLDLLDDNKFTSFPIAPPPECVLTRNNRHPTNEYRMKIHSQERRISLNPRINNTSDDDTNPNELFLIEDYIPRETTSNTGEASPIYGCKRVSISDLKSKYYKRKQLDHLPLRLKKSSALLPELPEVADKNINILGHIMQPKELVSQDHYLSDILATSNLKHCVICEKPLYELSSRLYEMEKDYQEIVCLGCTSRYEEAARVLEDYEFETTFDDTGRNDSMNSMDFADTAEILVEPSKKRKENQFSSHLIDTLQVAQNKSDLTVITRAPQKGPLSFIDMNTKLWFHEAKKKLRWRWRVSGLLPKFLTQTFQQSTNRESHDNPDR